jgi:DNA-binding MarR family transcriptional regulator
VTEKQASFGKGSRTFREDLSLELTNVAALLAHIAERDARRREAAADGRVTAGQIEVLIGARHARSAAFGLDLANPGWSVILELMRARLEDRPARMARLATDARVSLTTMLRWADLLRAAGLADRGPDPERKGGVVFTLNGAGAEAVDAYFAAVRTALLLA